MLYRFRVAYLCRTIQTISSDYCPIIYQTFILKLNNGSLIVGFPKRGIICKRLIIPYIEQGSTLAWWLTPRTPDPEVGGSSPTRVKPCCVLEQGTFTPQKLLVIPRKRWLRPNMNETLFSGTLRINQPTIYRTGRMKGIITINKCV